MKRSPLRAVVYILVMVLAFAAFNARNDGGDKSPAHATVTKHHAPEPHCIVIEFNNLRHRHILDHAWDSWKKGQPKKLHIARDEADANRRASTSPYPTKDGYDRDEYPPAMSDEGGKGADVRYVRSRENRSAGSEMGKQLHGYPDGTCFTYEKPPWKRK